MDSSSSEGGGSIYDFEEGIGLEIESDPDLRATGPSPIKTAVAAPPPARLSMIMAREAPLAVIFRRGPTDWVRLILWHTDTDQFELGQWFKGRIYPQRCDLSPDGSKLIYFASKINGRTLQDTEYTSSWTAISRPPYLTALALWPKGDCWNGGRTVR